VAKIHDAGTSLLSVINDILDFSKIEAGRLDVESIAFDVDEVIGSVATVTAQRAHEKGLEFLVHVPSDIPDRLVGDPLRLGQVLTNLVNNAVKFTERGEIDVTVTRVAESADQVQLRFSVRDTGVGMTREQAARLFQPFTQADMSTTRKHGGTGLGLTISRRLVELMGGQIWFESEPGAGTTFYFTVWCGVQTEPAKRRVIPEKLNRLRALVVDDNATACEILQRSLSTIASTVDVVASGKDAIAAIRERDLVAPYDIVFVDWRMPGMDGLDVSRHIKSDETIRHQPAIVLVTAFGREAVRAEAEQLQLDGFLVKPVTKSMLVDTLVNVFAADLNDVIDERPDEVQRLCGARLLLAEDNAINQQIAVEILEAAGARVVVANNGREALERLSGVAEDDAFHCVLMDLQMPEMDGLEATRKIRSNPHLAALPIIAMTAHATTEEQQRCFDAGMNGHVAKPIDPDHLIETLTRFYRPPKEEEGTGSVQRDDRGTQSARASADSTAALAAVDGLNAEAALSRMAGNRQLYVRLLREFVDEQGPALGRSGEAFATGDISTAGRIAHSLTGVAGNLGATRVAEYTRQLEKLIRDGAPATEVEAVRTVAAAELDSLIVALRAALPPADEQSTAMDESPLRQNAIASRAAAASLATLLSASDPTAAEFLEANRRVLQPLMGDDRWGQFETRVRGYEFDEAQAQLAEAVQRLTTGTDAKVYDTQRGSA
jgi:two-component system sensor histidine kinase/response regulator